MKKNINLGIIGILTITFVLMFSPIALSGNNEQGYISVSAENYMEVQPNIAEITIKVKTQDKASMQNAINQNKSIMDKVLSELNNMINKNNNDYIKTSNYTATTVYNYKDSKKVFECYEVSNNIIVHTKAIKNLGNIIDKSISSGATNIENLSFSIDNYEQQCNELISKSTKDAKTRADIIAHAASSEISGIKNLDASCNTNNYSPRLFMAKNMISEMSDSVNNSSTQISSGNIKLTSRVNASFYVK